MKKRRKEMRLERFLNILEGRDSEFKVQDDPLRKDKKFVLSLIWVLMEDSGLSVLEVIRWLALRGLKEQARAKKGVLVKGPLHVALHTADPNGCTYKEYPRKRVPSPFAVDHHVPLISDEENE